MVNTALSIREFILGLLARQPMSGYDIKTLLESFNWLIDIPSYGSLYPALHRLHGEGLVSVKVIPGEDKPAKKIYSVTEKGRALVRDRLDTLPDGDASLKAFLMRLILADNLSQERLVAQLTQRRRQVQTRHAAFEARSEGPTGGLSLGRELVRDYSLAIASAEIDWLDQALNRLASS